LAPSGWRASRLTNYPRCRFPPQGAAGRTSICAWQNFTRILALIPLVYVVERNRNIYLSILTDCSLNLFGTTLLAASVLGGRSAGERRGRGRPLAGPQFV
jgi:hypothetical protein